MTKVSCCFIPMHEKQDKLLNQSGKKKIFIKAIFQDGKLEETQGM